MIYCNWHVYLPWCLTKKRTCPYQPLGNPATITTWAHVTGENKHAGESINAGRQKSYGSPQHTISRCPIKPRSQNSESEYANSTPVSTPGRTTALITQNNPIESVWNLHLEKILLVSVLIDSGATANFTDHIAGEKPSLPLKPVTVWTIFKGVQPNHGKWLTTASHIWLSCLTIYQQQSSRKRIYLLSKDESQAVEDEALQ